MSERRWRGALIGCGFFAPNHLHAWRLLTGAQIVALCDLDLQKARALGSSFGVSATYGDAAALLEREQIDFVDIVTTVQSHRSLVELGARHGKLVVCQKPFAPSLEDADAMVAACQAARVPLLVHENFRWQRPFLEMASRIAAGAIGRPTSLRLRFRHRYDIYRQQPYLAQADRLAIMDVGLHLFDLARVLLGEVDSLHCRTQRLNPAVRGEDSFVASLRHERGATTVIDCSFFSACAAEQQLFPQTRALIEGTEGSIELLAEYRLREWHGSHVSEQDVEPPVPAWGAKPWHCIQDSIVGFQRHVLEVLEGRAEPQPSGAHNRDTLALALAAYDSAAQDKAIHLDRPKRAAA